VVAATCVPAGAVVGIAAAEPDGLVAAAAAVVVALVAAAPVVGAAVVGAAAAFVGAVVAVGLEEPPHAASMPTMVRDTIRRPVIL